MVSKDSVALEKAVHQRHQRQRFRDVPIGDRSWRGGLVQVHERGGEILDLPRGTRIYPHDVSMRMAKGGQSQMINIPKLADQIIVREEADIDRIGDRLVQKIRKSSENRGGYSYAADMA